MKPNSLYAQLELIPEPLERSGQSDYSIAQIWAGTKQHLSAVGTALLTYLCGSADLRVTVKRNYRGNTRFVAYDPVTQQRHTFSSEQELRVWVDQRYYQ